MLARLSAYVRGIARRRQISDEVEEELRFHLEQEIAAQVARGVSPAEARRMAMRDLGGLAQTREAVRDVRTIWADLLWRDLRYAARALRRAPGFTAVATVSLGLAIGATTAIFSLLNALVLRDLPVRDPDTLVQVSATTTLQGESPLTFTLFRELAARQQVFSGVIGTWGNSVVRIDDEARSVKGLLWAGTANLFDELGVRPARGRLLAAGSTTTDPLAADPIAILGYGFWQRHYGGDPNIIGRAIRIEGAPFTVVGVAPFGFTGFSVVMEPDITIPLGAVALVNAPAGAGLRTGVSRSVRFVGRLKAGVTVAQATARLSDTWPSVRAASVPSEFTGERRDEFLSMGLLVSSAARGQETALRARYTRPLVILLGIASLVLLIACTNMTGLLLSRTSVRRQEIGIRLALGGTRARIARQLMTEGVMVSMASAAAGVVFAFWATSKVAALVFAESTVPVVFDGRPDLFVMAVTTLVTVAAGLVCSALPAWRGTRGAASDALRAEGRTFSVSGRTGQLLVVAQVALSLVLLAAAGVLVRTLAELRRIDTGIERSDAVVVAYPEPAQPGAYDGIDNDAYYRQVLARIEALPGVERASVSLLKPGIGGGFREAVVRQGTSAAAGVAATRTPVAPGFFDALGIRLINGRDFDWRDESRSQRVAILSESLARRLFGNTDPLGQRVRVGLDPARDALEVIGVVRDARVYELRTDDAFAAYTAALQDPAPSYKCFVVRSETLSAADLRRAVEELGRERLGNVVTLRWITDQSLLLERLAAMISGFFGSIVLLLAGVGLFGLLAQTVAQRRKEIGIRIAVGADYRRVVSEIVRKGLAVTVTGLVVGGALALVGMRVVEALLFGVGPRDPMTLSTAAAALVAVAVVASIVPALRAARVDPITALRGD